LRGLYLDPGFKGFVNRAYIGYLHKLVTLGIFKRAGQFDLSGHLIDSG